LPARHCELNGPNLVSPFYSVTQRSIPIPPT
jgi:hypothetical protein